MTKWADYAISAVRYNEKRTHIDKVQAYEDGDKGLGALVEFSREQVVAAIKNKTTFVTMFKNKDGKWSKGQPVFIIKINKVEYIKTVDNGSERDNLENLPEF
ncbi:MAG: DUF3892 domain-containing protein [Planctomycetota bacterium]